MLDSIIKEILVPEEEIAEIVSRLAEKINEDYKGKNLVVICVLKGSVMFTVDLLKKIHVTNELEFIRVKSYGDSTESSGNINLILDFDRSDMADLDLLVIEDIVDSGNTLSYLVEHLKNKGARSVKTCTLLDKPSRRKVNFDPDYTGKIIPDEFVFGYGLDLFEKYRDLPYVAVVKPEYIDEIL